MPSPNRGKMMVSWFLLNFLFMCIGIALFSIAFQVQSSFKFYFSGFMTVNNDEGTHAIIPSIFMPIGLIMTGIALFGCFAAVNGDPGSLLWYFGILCSVVVIQLGASIAAFALHDGFENTLASKMEESIKSYYNNSDPSYYASVRNWDVIQPTLHCCGGHNYTEWVHVPFAPDEDFVPVFCCIGERRSGCSATITKSTLENATAAAKHIYIEGCLPKGISVTVHPMTMGIIGLVLAAFETLILIGTHKIAKSIDPAYQNV